MKLSPSSVTVLIGLVPALVLAWCLWRLVRPPRASNAAHFAQCVGLVALAGLLASLVQLAGLAAGWLASDFSPAFLVTLPLAWWILTGGWSVQQVFEATAKDVTGHRQSTFADNGLYFLALMIAQTFVVAMLLRRRDRVNLGRDPVGWIVFVLALANSLAGITWPWWGT
jgi:hypothetical protein